MKLRNSLGAGLLALALVTGLSAADAGEPQALSAQDIAGLVQAQPGSMVAVSVFATGLNNPRGLKFGPSGSLYVAEGGIGGTGSTAGLCEQVIPPVGPYAGARSGGRVSRISPSGTRTTVTTQLPTSQTSADLGSLVSGAADVAFVDGRLYVLVGGGGCSHGVRHRDNAVVRIRADGTPVLVANLSTWSKTQPVARPEEADFEPDGTWYGMVAWNGYLWAVEPNHGEVVRINPATGSIRRVIDVSASQGHVVPTAIARHGGYFYLGNLGTFPITDGTQRVWRLVNGHLNVVAEATTVLGLAFDRSNNLYILQNTTGNPGPTPGAGSILRVRPGGAPQPIVTGLTLPTAMTMGPDGDLYVSNVGFGPPPVGLGQVLRIHLPH